MHHTVTAPAPKRGPKPRVSRPRNTESRRGKVESRYTVGLTSSLANQVERYAGTIGASMSKAIAGLVRLGLESQENRKREFFKRLKDNLAEDDPNQQDRLVDEFRALILGR
jgi:hypothetical protein